MGYYLFPTPTQEATRLLSIIQHPDNSPMARANWLIPLLAGMTAALLFASTLQTHVNGSNDYYATDVGEFQNALPRWGTLHFTGYPQYAVSGSLIVSALRLAGVPPAAGASLVSLLWGALAVGLAARLALELGAAPLPALVGSLALAVATSMWIDASIAEVHTLTMAFTAAILWLAVRFGRAGRRADFFWLAFAFSQGVVHMRAVLFLAPAVLLLIAPQWRAALRYWLPAVVICLAAPLTYLYLPLREWMGAEWTFGQTSTWHGFWAMVLDTKAERILQPASGIGAWAERVRITLGLLADDLPLALQLVGLGGLFALVRRDHADAWREIAARREVVGLHLAWLAYAALALVIWEGRVSDALLAVKLPVALLVGVGLGVLITRLAEWRAAAGYVALAAATLTLAVVGWLHYPRVTAITRDRSVEATIATAEQAANPDRPLVLMALWGHSYWGLRYAQTYRGELEGLVVVDHNASAAQILADGYGLITLSETFYPRPLSWWDGLLGPVVLDTYAPGLIEIRTEPRLSAGRPDPFLVNDDLALEDASVTADAEGSFLVTLHWLARRAPIRDYSVAVHLVAADPPSGPGDILAQADANHPVEGWYPTTRWVEGQVVQDMYRLKAPPDTQPVAIRVTAYYANDAGEFVNGSWLALPVK
jgi:hypothetical protein